jgi:ATP-dependent Clp protease ATP-binding subunit ClpC
MPKINVYLPDELAAAVRDARLPVSAICQAALERAVRDVTSARGSDHTPSADNPPIGLFSRFTPRAREALELGERAANDASHNYIGTEHLLLGVVDQGTNLALRVLGALEIETADLRAELVASMGPPAHGGAVVSFTPLAKIALENTTKEALALGHNYIGCEHLLLGILATEEGLGSKVLRRMGLELRTTRRAVTTALSGFVHATTQLVPSNGTDALEEILRRLETIERRLPSEERAPDRL